MGEEEPHSLLDFKSKEEFRAACHQMAMRMHYLNRVAMGESHFSWEVADMLSRLGRVFDKHYNDKDVQAAFGYGLSKGTLAKDERRAALLKLMFDDE
ncbi:hypothetical protein LZG00_05830 [Rhodobacteraceae bacterium LMO-12]|nr:hypothetical protein [Rhodobacteraceae bacterium LMO-JJ12]